MEIKNLLLITKKERIWYQNQIIIQLNDFQKLLQQWELKQLKLRRIKYAYGFKY